MTRPEAARTRWTAVVGGVVLVAGLIFPSAVAQAKAVEPSAKSLAPQVRTADNVGSFNAAIVYAGQPQEFYYDVAVGSLRHAWWDGAKWNFETLDGPGSPGGNGRSITDNLGQWNAAALYGGQPHVWYFDVSTQSLRHAWWDGTTWHFETLDGPSSPGGNGRSTTDNVGQFNAVTLYGGQPHVWYYDQTAGSLRHAWWDGAKWDFETLDGTGSSGGNGRINGNVGLYNAVELYGGQPHVWYMDLAGTLRHGWWDGSMWHFETLDGLATPGGNGRTTDMVGGWKAVALYGGQPHVWYWDNGVASLRHAWWDGTKWNFETLDGPGSPGGNGRTATDNVGQANAVVIYLGQPHVWYFDQTTVSLHHAWWDGTRWNFEVLDGTGSPPGNGRVTDNVGGYNAVVLYGGQPHVWNHDFTTGSLRHDWWDGATWHFETLDGP